MSIDATIETICAALDRHDWNATHRALAAARHRDQAGGPRPDGYPSSTLGDGSGSRTTGGLTSVESATETLVYGRAVHDEHHELVTTAIAALMQIDQAKRTLERALQRIAQVADKPAERHTTPDCCEKFCEDQAAAGRKGRCEPCCRWKIRWAAEHDCTFAETPNVPQSVIDQRIALRENRKVRITGPDIGFV